MRLVANAPLVYIKIFQLTLNKLQQLAETGGAAPTVLQTNELDLKKEGEKEAEQNTVEQLEKQMNQLFKYVGHFCLLLVSDVVVSIRNVRGI